MTPIIIEIFENNNQIFGSGKIHAILKDRGYKISVKTVADILHENNLFPIRSSAKSLYLRDLERKENILKQNFIADKPNQYWVGDVTYFNYNNTKFYICVILDLYARKVVGCKISQNNSTQLTRDTFKQAYATRNISENLVFHSDQGSNYTSKTYRKYLSSLGVTQSFSKSGNPYDNSVVESFFKNMKAEELYRTKYHSELELKRAIHNYIDFYNKKRPHTYLRYWTPDKYEAEY